MIKEKLKKINNKELILLVGIAFVFILLLLFKIIIKSTHAYYNYEMAPVPIFTGEVGDFVGGKLEPSPYEGDADISTIVYANEGEGYRIIDTVPVFGFTLNEKKTKCKPEALPFSDIDITEGTITYDVTETTPNQISCYVVYDLSSDVVVYAYKQDSSGAKKYNDKTYTLVGDIPTNYKYSGFTCSDKGTEINYDASTGISFTTDKPNICYVYFDAQ